MPNSSITPVPNSNTPTPMQSATPRALGITGVIITIITCGSGLIQAAGGMPEVIKWLLLLLSKGWPAGIALLAISSWLVHIQQIAIMAGRIEATDNRLEDYTSKLGTALNKLIDRADSEDKRDAKNTELLANLITATDHLIQSTDRLEQTILRWVEPTAKTALSNEMQERIQGSANLTNAK